MEKNEHQMQQVKFVAVILVYRNSDDLKECIESFKEKIESCAIIIVNAYYDEKSKEEIEQLAMDYTCDFVNIENKGYSYGNNIGIEYAIQHYEFDYIIISNPDIVIKKWDNNLYYDGIAPKITTLRGTNQNPMCVKYNKPGRYLIYKGFKNNCMIAVYFGIMINKISNFFFILKEKDKKDFDIYTAHGSFFLLRKNSINILDPIFDNNMFLFSEEDVLAYKMKECNLKMRYYEGIQVLHKEDGSMKLSNILVNDELKKSNIYVYEKYNV